MDKKETKIVPFEQLSITNKFMFAMVFSHKEIAKRARFYQAMRDCETLSKGEKYRDLRELYIIFLCPACTGMTLGRSVDDNGAATLCLEPRASCLEPHPSRSFSLVNRLVLRLLRTA
jgi:hypothetical protein